MPLNPLNHHYAMENPASVYDEEAMTALELAGRTTAKVNEAVKAFNELESKTNENLDQQNHYNEETRTVTLPKEVKTETQHQINNGTFDRQIDEYLGSLESRVNNLLGAVSVGSTTMDAEVIDIRTGANGETFTNAGEAVRNALAMGNLVDDSNYAMKMPDANMVLHPSVYVLHFGIGATAIPRNLPFSKWVGRIGTMFTLSGTYYRQVYIDDNRIYTRNGTRADNWSEWRTLTKPEYIIDLNGNGDYTSILKALMDHPTNTRFIVKHGEYDILAQYQTVYGTSFFDNYTGYAGNPDVMTRGLFLGDGVELIGEGFVELLFNYTGNNNAVKNYFSVISTSQNNIVDGINITVADDSCRYLVHDDYATADGTNIFRNMMFKGYSHLGTVIGGGFGLYNTYIVENCAFRDIQESIAIAYHNNANTAKNNLFIRNCYCEGSIYLKHYGNSTQKSNAYVYNNKVTKIGITFGDLSNYPNENIALIEWGNNTDAKMDNLHNELVNKVEKALSCVIAPGYYSGNEFIDSPSLYHATLSVENGASYLYYANENEISSNAYRPVMYVDGVAYAGVILAESLGNHIYKVTATHNGTLKINIGKEATKDNFMVVKGTTLADYPQEYIAPGTMFIEDGVEPNDKITAGVLCGKKVVFDGDSICRGDYSETNTIGSGWASRIGERNLMEWYNVSESGGTVSQIAGLHNLCTYIDTIHNTHNTLDYFIFDGGTNDADRLMESGLGSITKGDFSGNYDVSTFCGAFETLLYKAINYYPSAKIGYIIAPKMGVWGSTQGKMLLPEIRETYFTKAKEICEKWGVPYLDLWNGCNLNPCLPCYYENTYRGEESVTRGYYYVDGQHPTGKGYDYITPAIESWMKTL